MSDLFVDNPQSAGLENQNGTDPRQRAWMEISAQAVENNARTLKEVLQPGCDLMAVVKADGYGHGAETVARAAICGGASSLGVATLQEGI